jgi:osmotically-inducible protein OsmY
MFSAPPGEDDSGGDTMWKLLQAAVRSRRRAFSTATRRSGRVPLVLLALGLAAPAAALDDAEITTAIETLYGLDRVVEAERIEVETVDGQVRLDGATRNLLAKAQAERIAGQVRGVRGVANRIEVRSPAPKRDRQVRADVAMALAENPAIEVYDIDVSVADGRVTLIGKVGSLAEKALAERAAKRVSGVVAVVNDIDLDLTAERADAQVRADIRQRLRASTLVDDAMIEVIVWNGQVELHGVVGSLAEKHAAVRAARVHGARAIDATELSVDPELGRELLRGSKYTPQTDAEIGAAVRDALRLDPRVDGDAIEVGIAGGGRVTLRGRVSDLQSKRLAERLAEQTVGVEAVSNRIEVHIDFRPTDAAIAERIRARLERNPLTRRESIEVTVAAGEVALAGSVDSPATVAEALDEAAAVRGVIDVHNRLRPADGRGVRQPRMAVADRPTPVRRGDDEVEIAIRRHLRWSPFIDAGEVAVTVAEGVATLDGAVANRRERQAAEDSAWRGGAVAVRNRLELAP